MVQIGTASLPHTQATLNYLVAMGERPITYAYQPPPWVPWSTAQIEKRAILIHDLRPAASEFSLDRVGFQLLTHRSSVKNFWDEDEIKRVYYPESIDLLKRVTEAAEVRVFDHTLRRRAPSEKGRSPKPSVPRQPANRVHVDQTATSGVTRLRVEYPMKPSNCFAAASPSSICGGRSNRQCSMRRSPSATRAASRRETLSSPISSFAIGAARLTISSTIRANAGSTRQQCARAKSCSSSVSTRAVARFAPHTAFVDPPAPQDTPPRESIEFRTFVIFGEMARH